MLIICMIACPGFLASMEDPMLASWSEFARGRECKKMVQWLRCRATARLTGTACPERLSVATPRFFGSLGIFITLKKGAKVRGCYGAFSHVSSDMESLLSDYLTGALTRDPRYRPLDVSEISATDIIVTITSQPFSVPDAASVDLQQKGVVITCDEGQASIFVPAEIKSVSYIEKLTAGKSCVISAFDAVTIR
jgi:AMMECR1 domain-containing protein